MQTPYIAAFSPGMDNLTAADDRNKSKNLKKLARLARSSLKQ
jgi:hypothetical protein